MKTLFFENVVENPRKVIQDLCDFLQVKFYLEMINVPVEFSSNISDEGFKEPSKAVSDRWIKGLSKTEIYIAEWIARNQIQSLGYSFTGAKPNLLKLIIYVLLWPLQLFTAFALNLDRMGNPVNYISKRFFSKK